MNAKNTEKLMKDFPTLFKPDPALKANLMAFGFECGDGWFNIIYTLCEKLIELKFDGQVVQVKEKFGGLRFYISGGPEAVYDAIEEAEQRSLETCETCGKPGRPNTKGWISTLCDECRKTR